MEGIDDFSDRRLKGWCIHCGASASGAEFTLDHVPSRSLLDRPLPDYAPTVPICGDCNNRLSRDEEYLRVFLTCVLEGTCEPDELRDEKVARALRRNPRLAAEMRAARAEPGLFDDGRTATWRPDLSRLIPPLVKNARGHFMYELGEAPDGEPVSAVAAPLTALTAEQRAGFEAVSLGAAWPEVGSRMMTRVAWLTTGGEGPDMEDGWIVVQPDVYRYAIHEYRAVRMVLREYLAFEAVWE